MIKYTLIIGLLLLSFAGIANDDEQEVTLKAKIKQLVVLRQATLDAQTDEEREEANSEFLMFMRDALQHPESFKTPFDTIPKLGDLRSGDNYFRMINWNLPYDDETNRYFCFVQYYDKKEKMHKVVELERGYKGLKGEYRKVFNEKNWYGALYYKIINSKTKKGKRKRVYMLLGWDGNNQYSSMKVIDVMTISGKRHTLWCRHIRLSLRKEHQAIHP